MNSVATALIIIICCGLIASCNKVAWPEKVCTIEKFDGAYTHSCSGNEKILKCIKQGDGIWRIEHYVDGSRLPVTDFSKLKPAFCP